ncbi:MAG: phosphohydrolase [Pseudomonadota bacterium]
MTQRKGDWIQVASGRQFWPLDPHADEVHLDDIAHALANQCRFSGHVRHFYSVAQHSYFVSLHCDPPDALWGLLHDAAEAYLVDLPRPVKKALRASWLTLFDDMEATVMRAVCERFGLPLVQPESVDRADDLLLATEARDLMAPLHPDWHHREENGYPVLPDRIIPWSPGRAAWAFKTRFDQLTRGAT